ncbi:MAG: hypothetical protein ABSE95_01230 [Thermodesulfobacteriota bacterium]
MTGNPHFFKVDQCLIYYNYLKKVVRVKEIGTSLFVKTPVLFTSDFRLGSLNFLRTIVFKKGMMIIDHQHQQASLWKLMGYDFGNG